MNYQEFLNALTEAVQRKLGSSYAVKCLPICKNNGAIHQSVIISDHVHNTSPCFPTESYFELCHSPKDINAIAEDILRAYRQEARQDFPTKWVLDKDALLSRVVFKMVSTAKNEALLKTIPHKDIGSLSLSLLPYLLVNRENGRLVTVLLHSRHIEMSNIPEQELFCHAWNNTASLLGYTINSIESLVASYTEGQRLAEAAYGSNRFPSMYVISNKLSLYGSVCILYPQVQETLSQQFGSGFYILPSSVHETIAIPAESFDQCQADSLKAIVTEINRTVLSCEEILTDNVYYYNRQEHKLLLAA